MKKPKYIWVVVWAEPGTMPTNLLSEPEIIERDGKRFVNAIWAGEREPREFRWIAKYRRVKP